MEVVVRLSKKKGTQNTDDDKQEEGSKNLDFSRLTRKKKREEKAARIEHGQKESWTY